MSYWVPALLASPTPLYQPLTLDGIVYTYMDVHIYIIWIIRI